MAAQDQDEDGGAKAEKQEKQKPKRKVVAYTDLKRPFQELCELIAADGRREALWRIVASQTEKDPECPGCKPFFFIFTTACKVEKPRKTFARGSGGGSASPSPSPSPEAARVVPQIEPSALVVDRASRLFYLLMADSRRADTYLAALRFVTLLRSAEGKNEGEFNYFSTLSDYVEASIEVYANSPEVKAKPSPSARPAVQGDVNELF